MTNEPQDIGIDIIAEGALTRRPTLTLDAALYDAYLEGSDLDEVQKRELLESLWAIIVGFVDLGFAVEPAAASADKSAGDSRKFASAGFAVAQSASNSTTDHFEKAAALPAPPGR